MADEKLTPGIAQGMATLEQGAIESAENAYKALAALSPAKRLPWELLDQGTKGDADPDLVCWISSRARGSQWPCRCLTMAPETPETIVPAPNRLAATTGGEQVAQPKQQQSWRQRQQRQIRLHSRRIECIAKCFAASKVSTKYVNDDQKDAGGQQPVADGLDDTAHATTRTLHTPRAAH